MKEQADRHKEELRQLREDNKENIRRLTIDSKNHQTASDNLIASLNRRITELTNTLQATQLSETEAKWLARYRHRQQFKKSTEQKKLLKSGQQMTREEEKDEWPGGSGSYQKNKPYTVNPIYHKLGDYFTLPEGGRFVRRNGEIETWWYRELVRIPEHYEEHFAYNTPFTRIVEKLSHMGLSINDKTLGIIVHKIITHIRKEMKDVWENTIKKLKFPTPLFWGGKL